YFQNGEYEKAAEMYDALYQKNGNNDFFFDRYFDSLLALEAYSEAESVLQKQIRRNDGNVRLYVSYGTLMERLGRYEEAEEQFNLAIEKLPADQYSISRLANAFISKTKYNFAIAAYEKGSELLRNERIFSYNMGDLYRRMGESKPMINAYLNAMEDSPKRIDQLKTVFQRYLSEEDYRELQTQLYTRIQEGSENPIYPELLAWVFIQRKDYRNAFRQVKALDRRLNENGTRIMELAEIAAEDEDYDAAIMAFDYLVEEKGNASTLYLKAKRRGLQARRMKLVEGFTYTQAELQELEGLYTVFLDEFGYTAATASIVIELAELQALYMNKLDSAVALLADVIELPGVNPRVQSMAKLDLADYYLMQGDIWESTLLYSQVDKRYKEDILGHEARFRNARLAYYNGDFQWAQAQFDVLKASTSKLIANDALDLSVFIMDNLGLDTTAQALQMYADADLLVFRNQFDGAFEKLDSLIAAFPEHSLEDDIIYLKGKVYEKQRDYSQAATLYKEVVERFPEDIRADNALFALAEMNEKFLDNKEEAMLLYENLFIDYSSSTFAVEARKRFRALRGDNI
ncbi:MAG: tetratricopeptide repeat protein, partial [Bacteroidota bacterium]